MEKYWNRFLNWLIPGRRARLLAKIMKMDQEAGLYDEWKDVTFPLSKDAMEKIVENEEPCCGNWDEFGRCNCEK